MPDQSLPPPPVPDAPVDDARPPGIDDYAASLSDERPQGIDQYAGQLLGDEAREHINADRRGQISLTMPERYQANLLAQQGKGNVERAWDKLSAAPGAAI